ncbi:MAG: ABC transporter permease [Ligilactobacillus agilis]|nr:ABC transporter permease [Ligilactobacillus agilis]
MLPQILLRWYLIPGIIAALCFFAISAANQKWLIPLNGTWSIETAATIMSLFCGLIAFMVAFIVQKHRKIGPAVELYWRNLPTLLIAFGTTMALSLTVVFWLLGKLFVGASFDLYTSTSFVLLIVAAITYLMINLAMTMSEAIITNLMTIMIVGGMLFAMLTNSNRDWWHYNFSYLGTRHNATNWRFNITLIFSALIIMTLVDYLFVKLQKKHPTIGVKVLRGILYAEAVCIGGIGIFPNDPRFHVFHDRISMMLVYILLLLILILRWLVPELPKQFLRLSDIIGALMAVEWLIFKLSDYLSLTAFELLEFGLAFSWLLLLFQNLEYLALIGDQIFPIQIREQADVNLRTNQQSDDHPEA